MKKRILISVALNALILSIAGQTVYANETGLQDAQADVTLKAGSGKGVKPVIDLADDTDENPVTGIEDVLPIPYTSSISFGKQEVQQGDVTYFVQNEKPLVQVDDTRGGAESWALSASISELKGVTSQGALKGVQLTLANGQIAAESNQSEAPTIVSNSLALNDSLQPTMLAEKGKGAGVWAALLQGEEDKDENIKLFIPRVGVEAQAYTTTITWGLSDAST